MGEGAQSRTTASEQGARGATLQAPPHPAPRPHPRPASAAHHPAGGAHKRGARDLVVAPAAATLDRRRHAKVPELHAAVGVDQDVAGLRGSMRAGACQQQRRGARGTDVALRRPQRLPCSRLCAQGRRTRTRMGSAPLAIARRPPVCPLPTPTPPTPRPSCTLTSRWMPPFLWTYSSPLSTSRTIVAITGSLRPCEGACDGRARGV